MGKQRKHKKRGNIATKKPSFKSNVTLCQEDEHLTLKLTSYSLSSTYEVYLIEYCKNKIGYLGIFKRMNLKENYVTFNYVILEEDYDYLDTKVLLLIKNFIISKETIISPNAKINPLLNPRCYLFK